MKMLITKIIIKGLRFVVNQFGFTLVSKAATTANEFVTEQVAIEDLLPTSSIHTLDPITLD